MIEFAMTTLDQAPIEWDDLWSTMRKIPDSWIPTTQSMYWDMLEVLPPAAMSNSGFLVGEPNHHNSNDEPVYACFMQNGNSFKAQYLTVREFNKL